MDREPTEIHVNEVRSARLRLEDYDASWPQLYADEALLITKALGSDVLALEHVGSTAIPGMPAKPIIDILLAIPSYDRFPMMLPRIEELNYEYRPEAEKDDPDRRVLRKGPTDMTLLRTQHLHVTEGDSGYWRRIIAFREHLRTNADDAAAYIEVKRELASRYADDRDSYARGKGPFVRAIEAKLHV